MLSPLEFEITPTSHGFCTRCRAKVRGTHMTCHPNGSIHHAASARVLYADDVWHSERCDGVVIACTLGEAFAQQHAAGFSSGNHASGRIVDCFGRTPFVDRSTELAPADGYPTRSASIDGCTRMTTRQRAFIDRLLQDRAIGSLHDAMRAAWEDDRSLDFPVPSFDRLSVQQASRFIEWLLDAPRELPDWLTHLDSE